MSISINLGEWGSVFAVPTCLVDKHIKIASPLQLKIILFLLKNCNNTYTCEQLGEYFSAHIDDVRDSVNFWVERGVIVDNQGIYQPNDEKIVKVDKIDVIADEKPKIRHTTRIVKPDLVTAAQRVSADESLQHLLAEVENALSKPLSSGDTATIVMLYDTCGLPAEVIAMLVNYCVSINKANIRTIERIGIEWSDNGVNTLETAENKIQQIKQSNTNWSMVRGVFGLKSVGSATKKQLEYANRWVGEWHFSSEMLRTAYELCVDQTGELSMPYINKILKRWQSAGVFKIEDIEKLDKKKPEKKKTATKASYDIDELEKIQ